MEKFRKILLATVLCLAMPALLDASGFSILDRPTKKIRELSLYTGEKSNYLDLKQLADLLGGRLEWESPGERLVWLLEGRPFVFEDLIAFFTVQGSPYQLVAPCLLDGGRFLVPAQFAVEYLPGLLPERFVYNKLDARLVDRTGITQPEPSAVGEQKEAAPPTVPRSTSKDGMSYRIHTVVIDPGHGGKDPGTLHRRYKLNEKDIVLDISQKVATKLKQKSQLKVILTRHQDTFIPLAERGRIANENAAGLFVSIHVNSAKSSGLNGSSTYFLDAAKTDEERATAMLENAALQYEIEGTDQEKRDEVNLILQDMAQNEFLRESKDLSTFIQLELAKIRSLKGRGLRQANFAVLRGTYMPAALVETAYISNSPDEKQLNSSSFRTRLAEAITEGILKYIDHYHKKLVSGS
jgi:N-acetylmuramoyl-L-alanine amidase